MEGLYLGILLVATLVSGYNNGYRVKRYSSNGQRGGKEWNWGRNGQLFAGQTRSQISWSSAKGDTTPSKGRANSKTNRDGTWTTDVRPPSSNEKGWSSNQPPQGNQKGSAYPGEEDAEGNLEVLLRGVPGMDFPNFLVVPETSFDCSGMATRGYYGDVEAGCQVFHICQPGNRKDSFLCPVGTIFNQKYFVCDWWFNVNCSDTPSYYDLNEEVYKQQQPDDIPVTTEPSLPWNEDLSKKRPSKSWGSPASPTKPATPRKDFPTRKIPKGASEIGTTRVTNNGWSHSDSQKEVTLSWSSSGSYGSSSTFIPTVKPIWYGIDELPAKDQSNGKYQGRNGQVQTSAPFGTRMRATPVTIEETWAPTEYQSHATPPSPSSTLKSTGTTNYEWSNDLVDTAIIPTEIKGVWEQRSSKKLDEDTHFAASGRKGHLKKLDIFDNTSHQSLEDQTETWGRRKVLRDASSNRISRFTTTPRRWTTRNTKKQNIADHSKTPNIDDRPFE
ncbi:uncharacterized protein LOC118186799 [Stegodyphus dumicola]|uniref:uncharacterized protein LOC118186799 n=1 Tax=Stegodyphus dumicola TaxID=202533 RepID=UPI0015A8211B|nr:uncharacterized protein LOC118186799 [Stegodyphus dumicola]XP_035212839.1 uncharacterized protein LOC118186799 [Stegodyphus dumicola]XP_035212840.1 uncharacterized protein LOC118186799 [Stegodyphus dumicola]